MSRGGFGGANVWFHGLLVPRIVPPSVLLVGMLLWGACGGSELRENEGTRQGAGVVVHEGDPALAGLADLNAEGRSAARAQLIRRYNALAEGADTEAMVALREEAFGVIQEAYFRDYNERFNRTFANDLSAEFEARVQEEQELFELLQALGEPRGWTIVVGSLSRPRSERADRAAVEYVRSVGVPEAERESLGAFLGQRLAESPGHERLYRLLGAVPGPSAQRALLAEFEREVAQRRSSWRLIALLDELGRRGEPGAVEPILALLVSGLPRMQERDAHARPGLRAMMSGHFSNGEFEGIGPRGMNSRLESHAVAAVISHGALALEPLLQMLRHESAKVEAASRAQHELHEEHNRRHGTLQTMPTLDDRARTIEFAAIELLGWLGDERARGPLSEVLTHGDGRLRVAAAAALIALGHQDEDASLEMVRRVRSSFPQPPLVLELGSMRGLEHAGMLGLYPGHEFSTGRTGPPPLGLSPYFRAASAEEQAVLLPQLSGLLGGIERVLSPAELELTRACDTRIPCYVELLGELTPDSSGSMRGRGPGNSTLLKLEAVLCRFGNGDPAVIDVLLPWLEFTDDQLVAHRFFAFRTLRSVGHGSEHLRSRLEELRAAGSESTFQRALRVRLQTLRAE